MDSYRLKIKIGSAEFEAEGPEQAVKEQFEQFKAMLENAPVVASTPVSAPQPPAASNSVPPGSAGDMDAQTLARVFEVSKDGVVSLRRQPGGENQRGNAIVLLLYGYRALAREDMVLANRITRGMEISGLKIERVDRFESAIGRYLTQGGTRSGSRYGLNNPGVQYAEELIRALLA